MQVVDTNAVFMKKVVENPVRFCQQKTHAWQLDTILAERLK